MLSRPCARPTQLVTTRLGQGPNGDGRPTSGVAATPKGSMKLSSRTYVSASSLAFPSSSSSSSLPPPLPLPLPPLPFQSKRLPAGSPRPCQGRSYSAVRAHCRTPRVSRTAPTPRSRRESVGAVSKAPLPAFRFFICRRRRG